MGHTCTRHAHACTQRACTHSHRLGAPLHSLHLSLHLSLYTTAPPHRPFVPAALGPLSRLLARRPRQAGWPGATPTRTLLLTYSRLSGDGRVAGRSMVRGRARCVPRCSNACLSRTPAASSPLPRRSAPCDQHHHTSEGPHHCSASPPPLPPHPPPCTAHQTHTPKRTVPLCLRQERQRYFNSLSRLHADQHPVLGYVRSTRKLCLPEEAMRG